MLKTSSLRILAAVVVLIVPLVRTGFAGNSNTGAAKARRQMESLGRGVVAIHQGGGVVYVGWRLLGTDPDDIAFNLYRSLGEDEPVKLNAEPIMDTTNFEDRNVDLSRGVSYVVRPVLDGVEQPASAPWSLPPDAPARPYLSVPLQTPEGYQPNDVSVGDLTGNGEYELVVHMAGRGRDNSQAGDTDPPILQAYTLDGTRLWTIRLGKNIREGAHYTQFIVYDLDGDGRAEVACKTADGTVDGQGKVVGDPEADWRNDRGTILAGPEYLSLFDGRTGAALATTDYIPPRGRVADWGDDYGNRVDRFLACVAYLDGQRPSLVMCRGYYTRTVLAAWNWRDGRLTHLWTFDSHDETPGNRRYAGQGNHSVSVADVDADGHDEIIYGGMVVDHDGQGLYSTGLGHGDAQHTSDLDPNRPGLETFSIHEHPRHEHGIDLRDARTGEILWSHPSPDVGRGLAIDIDPRHPGAECWASGRGLNALYDIQGEPISETKPRSCNMAVWWDADPLRELLDGTTIAKWDWEQHRTVRLLDAARFGCASINGSKANPNLSADILGDWREEVIWRTRDNQELRIFTTTIPATNRIVTLMHDPVYRLGVASENVGYNQPPHTGFHLGQGMSPRPAPPGDRPGRPRPAPLT